MCSNTDSKWRYCFQKETLKVKCKKTELLVWTAQGKITFFNRFKMENSTWSIYHCLETEVRGHFRITLAQTDLSFSWLGMRIALEVNWFSHVKLWGCFLNGKDKTHCIFAPKEFEGYCLFITEIIIGRLTIGLLEISLIQAQNIVHNCYLATFGNKNFFMLQHSQHIY